MAHEYLAIFKKPLEKIRKSRKLEIEEKQNLFLSKEDIEELETTTVWIFNQKKWYGNAIKNLVRRYQAKDYFIIKESMDFKNLESSKKSKDLILIRCFDQAGYKEFRNHCDIVMDRIRDSGYLALMSNDIRQTDGSIYPLEIEIEKHLESKDELKIKEIVVLSIENRNFNKPKQRQDNLNINHKYLLVYRVEKN